MILEGLLLDLVPFTDLFEDRFRAWRNGPMRDWLMLDGLISRTQHAAWRAQIQEQSAAHAMPPIRFGALARVPGVIVGEPVGWFWLQHIHPYHRTAEISAGFGDPAHWERGLGADALLVVADYAFRWLDLRRLCFVTAASNTPARRAVEQCGFTCECTGRQEWRVLGDYQDAVYYGLLRAEWPGRAAMVMRLGLHEQTRGRGL